MKDFFKYLKEKNILFNFNIVTNEILVERCYLTNELRQKVINYELNIFELDNIIIIF